VYYPDGSGNDRTGPAQSGSQCYGCHAGGGILTVGLFQKNDTVQVSISDSGSGISEENKGSIFSPFFTTKEDGTGLGLSIVDHIIRLHEGNLSFTTSPTGPTFTIIWKINDLP